MTTTSAPEAEASDPSYIDYELFLDPLFSAASFANTLVLNTNNPTDTPLDLSTPLSRVLFDIQEVDSHIHSLTSASAIPLLSHTQSQSSSSSRIVNELSNQVASLNDSYKRLEKEITGRYEAAEEVRLVSERLWHTVRLGRAVGRALQLGRQLEVQMNELQSPSNPPSGSTTKLREDHRAMVRAANTTISLRSLFDASNPGEEGEGLARVDVIQTLRSSFLDPSNRTLLSKSQQIIREFSMSTLSNSTTYTKTEETKARTTSALLTLFLLSPSPSPPPHASRPAAAGTPRTPASAQHHPEAMIEALQDYLRTAHTSSLTTLVRALGTLPTLERTLLEISARCQNISALEALLESIKPPPAPSPATPNTSVAHALPANFLHPLLAALETASLASYFWRSLASALSPRVQDLVNKGGVQARALRSRKAEVRDAIRECVVRGSQTPPGVASANGAHKGDGGWEREVAVMVGAVVGHLGR